MRRQLNKFLPVFLIALTVQILVPVAASWSAAVTAVDPLGSADICVSHAGTPASGDPGADHRISHGPCLVCCAAQADVALDTPNQAIVATPDAQSVGEVWRNGVAAGDAASTVSSMQARAPPRMS